MKGHFYPGVEVGRDVVVYTFANERFRAHMVNFRTGWLEVAMPDGSTRIFTRNRWGEWQDANHVLLAFIRPVVPLTDLINRKRQTA